MALTEEDKKVVEARILHHKAKLKNEIRDGHLEMQILSDKVDDIEASLKRAETQRTDANASIHLAIDELREWMTNHDGLKETQYEEILQSIASLAETVNTVIEETKQNSRYISEKAYNDSIDDEVARRLDVEHAPKEAIWNRVKNTAISLITGAVLIAMGTGALFIYDLYKKMGG